MLDIFAMNTGQSLVAADLQRRFLGFIVVVVVDAGQFTGHSQLDIGHVFGDHVAQILTKTLLYGDVCVWCFVQVEVVRFLLELSNRKGVEIQFQIN